MNAFEVTQLTNFVVNKNEVVIIHHDNRDSNYYIRGIIPVKIAGEWVVYTQYQSIETGDMYAREKTDFHGFRRVCTKQ